MKYCSKCGNELYDEAVICPGCGCAVQTAYEKVLCQNCGNLVEKGQSFCPACGSSMCLDNRVSTKKSNKKTEFRSLDSIFYSALAAISIILMYIPLFFEYRRIDTGIYGGTDYYNSSLSHLADGNELWVIALVLSVVVLGWIFFITKIKAFRIPMIALSGTTLISYLSVAFIGKEKFNDTYKYIDYAYGHYFDTTIAEIFESFGILFYIEIFVFLAMITLSILNMCGIYFIKIGKSSIDAI